MKRDLSGMDIEWLSGSGDKSSIVISCRIRLARNLRGRRFPGIAQAEEAQQVRDEIVQAIERSAFFKGFDVVDTAGLKPLELHMLVEKRLISPLLANASLQGAPSRAVVLGPRAALVAMINEEDHLRLQSIRPGLDLEQGWNQLNAMDDALEERLEFSFSQDLGYMAACPTNLGTGMRASVMLHLPALALANALETIKEQIVSQVGLAVRGIFGEGSGMHGNLLQISNQISLGPAEEDLIGSVKGIASRIVEQETAARLKLRREFSAQLGDRVWRALGIMRHAQVMSAVEALELLSMVRLGVDLEILPPLKRNQLNELLVSICPATLQILMGECSDPVQADMMRARRIRQELGEERG